jgi:hypothetical protein
MSGPSTAGAERRKYERKVFRGAAQIEFPGHQRFAVRVLNISTSGTGIITPTDMPSNTICTILFSVPSSSHGTEALEVRATVIHRAPRKGAAGFIVGLRFDNPSPRMISLINKLAPAV